MAFYEGCENEPVHLPGSIQPQGALLSMDCDYGEVLQASLNMERYLGHKPANLLGRHVASILGDGPAREIIASTLKPDYPNLHEPLSVAVRGEDGQEYGLIMMAHRHDGVIVLEFNPVLANSRHG